MKSYLIGIVLLFSCTFAQAQINVPEVDDESRFSLGLNGRFDSFYGLSAELNLGVELNKGRSLYLGMGSNKRFHKYARLGIMQDIIVRKRFTLGVGAGLLFQHSNYSLLSQGKMNSVNFEIPIEAEYRISDKFSATASLRTGLTLYQQSENYKFGLSQGFSRSLNLGVKYSFSGKNK